MTNYTIALWQEGPPGTQTASKGPVLFGTVTGPDTGFKWEVQLYDFKLKDSNVFFLWLKQGGANNQHNNNAPGFSTPYFNITNAPRPITTSKPSTTTDLSTSTNPPSSTSSPAESPSPMSTASSSTSASASPSSTAPSADNDAEPSVQGTSGLPVGAQAGIGVGVAVIGATCILCAVLWYRHLKKKRQILADSQKNDITTYSPSMTDPWKPASELPHGHFLYPPAELQHGRSPVEIGAGGDFAEMPTSRDHRPAEQGNQ
ncbi:hypothetical protein B0I37DRAFT_419412 [Chaetomium sp. MPI-CAGE-AT-0009]|nr:hypothetical protein B0I37DRAFT_419412 [Chaetomium sp. MPI-CAGE-AT-0009]